MKVNITKRGKTKIRIDKHDLDNIQTNLSRVILATLTELKKSNVCIPDLNVHVSIEDCLWSEFLDQMIFSFGELANDRPNFPKKPQHDSSLGILRAVYIYNDFGASRFVQPEEDPDWIKYDESVDKYKKDVDRGLRLFGKYFQQMEVY